MYTYLETITLTSLVLSRGSELNMFEEFLFSNGLIPTISTATHFKPGCKPSCIDNILTLSSDSVRISGVLDPITSHHSPVFCFFNIDNPQNCSTIPQVTLKFDYCQSNIDQFIITLEEKLYNPVTFNIDSDEFEKFTTIIKETMEDSFKVDPSTLSSRRNRLVNPWITSGIIESIQTKTFLYHQWKKTVTETDKVGDHTLYMNYKDFRKTLKNTIIQAKRLNSYKNSNLQKEFVKELGN